MSKVNRPYKIGYGKPPHKNQFQEGISGNPLGRPKKKLPTFVEAFERELTNPTLIKVGGKSRRVPLIEVIAKQYVAKAANGDTKAAMLVMNVIRGCGSDKNNNLSPIIDALRNINAKHEAKQREPVEAGENTDCASEVKGDGDGT